jgi:hypothetical protein
MASRLSAVFMLVVFASACATPRVVRLDTGQGELLEHVPPTTNRSVAVGEEHFEESLARLMLEESLVVRPAGQGFVVRASYSPPDEDTAYWLGKALGGPCRPGQPRNECVSLLDDVMGLNQGEKLALGLGMSLQPMRESIARALEDTMTPQFFAAAIGAGMVSWVLLAANPEPVFTKVAAVVAAVMVIYLGVDAFLAVVKACQELKRASEEAVTLEEMEEASQRFGTQVGPEVSRVFILALTVMISRGTMGGSTWLAGRMPLLPRFAEASAVGGAQVGVRLASVGEVSSVAVVQGNLVISLAPTAVAMVISPRSVRSWGSHSGLSKALGPAGKGKEWHHLVEQTPGNVKRFGPHALHNTENVIALEKALHTRVSAFYSSIQLDVTGSPTLTVRQWLSTQSYAAQRKFGLLAVENVRKGIW